MTAARLVPRIRILFDGTNSLEGKTVGQLLEDDNDDGCCVAEEEDVWRNGQTKKMNEGVTEQASKLERRKKEGAEERDKRHGEGKREREKERKTERQKDRRGGGGGVSIQGQHETTSAQGVAGTWSYN